MFLKFSQVYQNLLCFLWCAKWEKKEIQDLKSGNKYVLETGITVKWYSKKH